MTLSLSCFLIPPKVSCLSKCLLDMATGMHRKQLDIFILVTIFCQGEDTWMEMWCLLLLF